MQSWNIIYSSFSSCLGLAFFSLDRCFSENHDLIEKNQISFCLLHIQNQCYQNEQKSIFSRDLKWATLAGRAQGIVIISLQCYWINSVQPFQGAVQTSGCEITAQRKSFKCAFVFKEKFSSENTPMLEKYFMFLFLYQKGTRLDYNTEFEKTGEVMSDPFTLQHLMGTDCSTQRSVFTKLPVHEVV